MHKICVGDCLEVLVKLRTASVDLVLSDLPYGKTQNAWDKPIAFASMWRELRRVAKPAAAIVLMAAEPFAAQLICSNLEDFRYDLIWRKNKPTGFLNAKRQPLRVHEHVLVFYRAPPVYNPQMTQGHEPVHAATQTSHGKNYGAKTQEIVSGGSTERYPTSVLEISIINNDDPTKCHPTQKPVALMEWLIATYSRPNEIVLDITAGSGTTGEAAANLGRHAILIEANPEYAAMIERRLTK
jgi:DNA modification methylase